MNKVWLVGIAMCALSACSAQGIRGDAQWEAYRAQVAHDEETGVLSPSQAQERLRDGWVNMHGKDPTMAGFFAYSETLMRSAERGLIPMSEAKELVKERERAVWMEYQTAQRHRRELSGPDYDL
jgi:hypothetical protein